MKKRWVKIIATLAMVSVCLSWVGTEAVWADVIAPGTRTIEYCAEITGMQNFSDYVFLSIDRSGIAQKLETGNCLNFTRNTPRTIGAVKSADYNPADKYAVGNPKFITANLFLGYAPNTSAILYEMRSVPDASPLTKAVDVLKIAEVSAGSVNLQKASVRYTFKDGKTTELPYVDQNTRPAVPASSSNSSSSPSSGSSDSSISWWWFVVIPAVAIVGIAAILMLRGRRRSS